MWTVQFVSTALILLLINANYSNVMTLPEGTPILAGEYQDFSSEWYGVVGATIVLSCFFNAVMPLMNFLYWF